MGSLSACQIYHNKNQIDKKKTAYLSSRYAFLIHAIFYRISIKYLSEFINCDAIKHGIGKSLRTPLEKIVCVCLYIYLLRTWLFLSWRYHYQHSGIGSYDDLTTWLHSSWMSVHQHWSLLYAVTQLTWDRYQKILTYNYHSYYTASSGRLIQIKMNNTKATKAF